MTSERIDLGHGVTIELQAWREHDPVGLIEFHTNAETGGECVGGVMFDLPGVREAFPGSSLWTLVSADPLTLSPSLLCMICGHHGFISAGRWVPA